MRTACMMRACGKELASATSAAAHVTHHPFPRRTALKGQLWRVRWNRAATSIVEVLGGPRPPRSGPPDHAQIPVGAGPDGTEIEHRGLGYVFTPCLCDCHYGKPECNEVKCA